MSDKSRLSGSCLCGAVRFETDAPTLWCAHCHCRLCQRAHGAAFITWVGVHSDGFGLADPDTRLEWYASSNDSERGFCRSCGTTLFFRSQRWPGETHIARACFDGDIDRDPSAHVYFESHAHWFPFVDDLPHKMS